MSSRIVYRREDGGVSIIIPADNGMTIEEIAAKDVPAGFPYKIVDETEIPADRSNRNAWFVEESDLTDGIGGEQ